jgi:hypothetical protein
MLFSQVLGNPLPAGKFAGDGVGKSKYLIFYYPAKRGLKAARKSNILSQGRGETNGERGGKQ